MGAYVTPMYGGSKAQIDYRLGLVQHGCDADHQFSYHADARERPLRWIGRGLEAFGVEGLAAGSELTGEQHEMAHRLIRGQHPVTGEQLVAPKVAVPADAKVSLAPVVAAVHEAAQARGVAPETLFQGASLAKAWDTAAQGVARRGGRAVARVDEAARLAEAAGLAPGEVWGADRVADARAALYEPRQAVDAAGEPVLEADGTPRIEMVERRERVGIAGYDIGINLPKSLSLLLAFAPEETAARVEGVYAQATEKTLGWTEGRTSYVQRGKHGGGRTARREESAGFSGWVMTHRAARPVGELPIGDPHWHVHITIANMAQAPDGSWLTIGAGGRELMRHAAAIDKVTQGEIRAQLHSEFGISFTRAENGAWEVEHIPQAAVELFSKRHQQVSEVLSALGYSNATASAKEARVLTRACRSGKSETVAAPDVTLREYWRAQALAAGYDPADWMPQVLAGYEAGHSGGSAQANEMMLARHGVSLDDVVARLSDPEHGLTAHTRRFSHLDALTATADALPHGASVAEVEQLTELVLAHPSFVTLPEAGVVVGPGGERAQLAGSHRMAGGALYTTRDVPEAEREILEVVAAAQAAGPGRCLVDAQVLAGAIARVEADQGYPLSGEQRQVLERLTGAGRAVETLEGPPGCGKTTLMRAAREAWEAAGYRVAGAATQGVTAQGLAAESGIESRTCAQWRVRIEDGPGLAGIDKLVIDETSLTDDRDRQILYREAARTGTEILEVLDPHQLRTPGCGSLGAYIHSQLDGARLTENRRQRSEDERAAITLYREGRHHEALIRWQDMGQVVATRTTEQGVAAMVADWMRRAEGAADPHTRTNGLMMIAATNEMVDRLNGAVQAVRGLEGQLGEATTVAMPGGRSVSFHVGDAVLIRRNDRTQQAVAGDAVLNGYQGVVTAVSAAGVAVEWHQPGDTEGQLPHTATCSPQYIAGGGLELGYCITGHKSQGKTIGAQWVLPDSVRNEGSVLAWGPGMDRAGLLVALSRAQGETRIYGGLDAVEGEREELLLGTPATNEEVSDRVVGALAARADATYANPNDTPTLVDLGEVAEHPAAIAARALGQHGPERTDAVSQIDHEAEPVAIQDPAEVQEPAAQEPVVAASDEPATVESESPVEYWLDDHWRQLNRQLDDAQLTGSDDEVQLAFEERQTYENEVLDPAGHNRSRQESWERYAGRVLLTDEHRRRDEELIARRTQAFIDRDPAAREAAVAAHHAYRAELGPDRAHRLHREIMDRMRVERETRQRWTERPHSKLTAAQLTQAITDAEAARAADVAAAERLRAAIAASEPAVAAGQGPQATRVDEHLARLRRDLERTAAGARMVERLQAARTTERMSAAQANAKRAEAERAPWYRPGLREQLLEEAAQLQTRAQQAAAEREAHQRQLGELDAAGAAPAGGYNHHAERRVHEALQRAENSYEQDRAQAHQVDHAMLGSQRDRLARHNAGAEGAVNRHAALAAEQTHRAEMPADQAAAESQLRLRWIAEQNRLAEEQSRRQQRARGRDDGYEYGLDHGVDQGVHHDRDQDHGFGMGL